MRLLPERWTPRPRHGLGSGLRCGLLILVAGAAGVGALWLWSDRLLAGLYEHWRPRLERQVGQVMGHPLQLGPFRGIGVDGLRIGPSRFLSGPHDGSTASVEEAQVWIDPLASWRQRTLILDLSFSGARADLRRNPRGQLWVLGPIQPGQTPPRLSLTFRLLQPGRVRLWGVGVGPGPLELMAVGRVGLRTHLREMDLRARAQLPGASGSVLVNGSGQWQARRWQADLTAQRLPLAPFRSLLPFRLPTAPPGAPGPLSGHADGRLALTLVRGVAGCSGDLQVRQLRWQQQGWATPITIERLPLRCRNRQLEATPSPWRFGAWSGQVAARIATDLRMAVRLRALPPPSQALGTTPIEANLQGRWQGGALRIARLDGSRGASTLEGSGSLGTAVDLLARWRLDPTDLPRAEALPSWLLQRPLAGSLRVDGRRDAPRLRVETGQPSHALLGPWQASLQWSEGQLRLDRFSGDHLGATAVLPLGFRPGSGLVHGDLKAQLALKAFPLQRLNPLLGTRLQGQLEAQGLVRGPLRELRPDLELLVRQPGAGPLLLQEAWRGTLVGSGAAGGGRLSLSALAPAAPGRLEAQLDRRWMPVGIDLERNSGHLHLSGTPRGYRWQARGFPLQGLALATGPQQRFQPLLGDLSGSGALELQPLAFNGQVDLARLRFLGVSAQRLQAKVGYADRNYQIRGTVTPLGFGTIRTDISGRWQGPFRARFEVRQLTTALVQQLAAAWPLWRGEAAAARGQASDLGSLAIDTFGGSLQDQLQALQQAQERLLERDRRANEASRAERLASLQTSIDADLLLRGPNLRRARVELNAMGHLWLNHAERAEALAAEPFQVQLEGPLGAGEGSFSLSGLSLGLLALLTPVPENLRGILAVRGRYRLGGERPELAVDLSLGDAWLGNQALRLERGIVKLQQDGLAVDLAMRAVGASSSVNLTGTIPLERQSRKLELRLASRGDGLRFLTRLAGDALEWKRGSTDLQLLVRGSLADPIANGFLRLRGGECRFIGQMVRGIEATVLFDFEQLLVQEFTARVGAKGRISGEGKLGLVRPLSREQTLAVTLTGVPFSVPRIAAVSDGRISFGGALVAPQMGGELAISRGTINAQPGQLARSNGPGTPASNQPARPVSLNELLETKWDFRQPLVLLGPDVESATGESLRQAIPRAPWLAFEGLRLRFGPDLRVVLPNVANFTTGGSLRISGRLDPSLRATGVVRLLGGRLNLFTTSFNLDPNAPNVAIFTPSQGLVPFLDIALRTRVSDSLSVVAPSGVGSTNGTTLADIESLRGFSSLNQLKLILVTVSVSGPADRIAENIRLRSTPPLPQDRLVALIGGNTLAGLGGGGAGTALATVLGQTLLSPLLGSLSDALGQRVSLALYPTYVNQQLSKEREIRSRRVPPQLVLGSEIGFDITDRLNVSVLAAPNRSDVPPQLTLNYKASESFSLEGSFDSQGAWQSQLRLFFRF